MTQIRFWLSSAVLLFSANILAADNAEWRSMPEVLAAATAKDWREIEPQNLLYMELDGGTVIMELAPQFAPMHVANLRKLLAAGHFKEASIKRSQDNYVAQWSGSGPLGDAAEKLAPEFYRDSRGLTFTKLASRDPYAAEVGFVDGLPVGRDPASGRIWLAHCYRMLGAGRDMAADSGNAAELYVVNGHAPRHLDRNVTLLGRVIDGIEHLTTLPRGTGPLGFYEDEKDFVRIRSLRLGTDYDNGWQALRTDTDTFAALVESRRHRNEDWFLDPAGAIELCNVPLPVRRVE
ncbi:MAG: peptidylprolyl isomerase [Woeseia sp.]